VIFLDLDDLLIIAERVLDGPAAVRDTGLLHAALARPQAATGGRDAYPTIHEKAAALLHSLSRNPALVEGNKRLSLAGTIAFYGMNGYRLRMTNEAAFDLVASVVAGNDDLQTTALLLKTATVRPKQHGPSPRS